MRAGHYTGFGQYWQVVTLGQDYTMVAPPLIPRTAGDWIKTNSRDAVQLARLLRPGEVTAACVPDRDPKRYTSWFGAGGCGR